jgi:hypothetical protein
MNRIAFAVSIALLLGANAAALAKTTSGTVPVSIQLVNGSTVGAYLVHNSVATLVARGPRTLALPPGALPILRVNFDSEPSWALVQRVTWDKATHHLTIDF